MNKCNNCGVFINSGESKCPLCNRKPDETGSTSQNTWYPEYSCAKAPRLSLAKKVFLFISITAASICVLVNLLSGVKNHWSVYVVGPIVYLQLLINNTVFSKTHAGTKIILQITGISGILLIIDLLSGFYRWSVNIVIPFLIIVGTFLITIIMIRKKLLWSEYAGYIIAMIFLGFLPVLLYLSGIADQLWASAASALYSLLTIAGMLVFSRKKFTNEVTRRFHI